MNPLYRELNISNHYESIREQNIVSDFFQPVLANTKSYKRLVGYFSSETLILAAKGILELVNNDGTIELLATVDFKNDETLNLDKREQIFEDRLLKSLSPPLDTFQRARLGVIAELLEKQKLKIRIMIPKDHTVNGIFYEKLAILEDYAGDKLAFTSQINETKGEYITNYEVFDVFKSWIMSEQVRIEEKSNKFSRFWEGKDSLYEVIELPKSVEKFLLTFKVKKEELIEPEIININNTDVNLEYFPKIPEFIQLREYQQEAIRNWFRNNCQGLLEMATGTGKTITALSATSKLWEVTKRLGVVIVCPYTHLVDQWTEDIKDFNMAPIVAYQSKQTWESALYNEISAFKSGVINHFCVITTNATFATDGMQNILRKLDTDILFIADEAHHLGAAKNRRNLIESFPYRLALSATPNRWHDEEGTEELIKYFGNSIVYQFGLEKAIGTFLTEYYYYPHIVTLDEDESESYYEITRKISRIFYQEELLDEKSSLQSLLIERSRIISRARNKLVTLRQLMEQRKDSKYNIIYCGDSKTDGEKQIDAVVSLLGNELDMKVHTFTSREAADERQSLLQRFENGDLQALVAIKCLDEGVDVPATQTAYILSSSTNPREFIQRRGRVLRKHKNKQYSYIHDFIVIPRNLEEVHLVEPMLFNTERNLIKRELTRFIEFADLAINGPMAHEQLNKLKHAYNLLDV